MSRIGTTLVACSVLALCILYGNIASAQCEIVVTEPMTDGIEVGKTYLVKGTAVIPDDTYLWVLSRSEDYEGFWWPQSQGKIKGANNTWKVKVTFGEADDIGSDFDIAIAVFPRSSHLKLKAYRKNAMKSGKWDPIEMPPVSCPPVRKYVSKSSH